MECRLPCCCCSCFFFARPRRRRANAGRLSQSRCIKGGCRLSARRPAFVRTNWQQSTAAAVPSESVMSRSSTGRCGGGGDDGSNTDDDRSGSSDVKDKDGSGVSLSALRTASFSVGAAAAAAAAAAVGESRAVAMTGVEESPERAAKNA